MEARRRAIGTSSPQEGEGAAAVLPLTAASLGLLFKSLKPHDPGTKSGGVLNFYPHTALAHVRSTVHRRGAQPPLQLKNYASRGDPLVNTEAIDPMTFTAAIGRSVAEMNVSTKFVLIFSCLYNLSQTVRQDVAAMTAFAFKDPEI